MTEIRTLSDASNRTLSDGSNRTIRQASALVHVTFEGMFSAGVWTDITSDVMVGWELNTGFSSVRPDKLMADIGTLSFDLKNGTSNSAGLDGYYSPGHANCRAGFAKKMPVRIKTITAGTVTFYKFYIKSIEPAAGQYGPRRTAVTAQDKLASMSRQNVGLLGVQTSARSDDLLDLLVADMFSPPANTSFATGPDVFASAFTDIESEKMKQTAVANHIIMSDWSRLFLAPDSTDGETLTSITRSAGNGDSEVTIDDVMTEIEPIVTLDNLVTRVRVTAYPNAVNADTEIVYTHPNELYVGPNETKDFYARFTDYQTGERICAADVDTSLTAFTDYTAGSSSAVGGTIVELVGDIILTIDMTSLCSIVISSDAEPVGADRAHVYVTNASTTYPLYLNYLVLRGSPIRRRDTFEIEVASTTIAADEESTLNIKMPYTSDVNLPAAIARKLIDDWGSEDAVRAYAVKFNANRNSTLADLAFNKPLGTKITLQETQSGLDFDGLVLGKSFSDRGNGIVDCKLVVDPAFGISGWRLGVSRLGVDTVLAL